MLARAGCWLYTWGGATNVFTILLSGDSCGHSEICALSVLIATSEARLNLSKVQESIFHLFQHGLDGILHIYEHNLMLLLIPWQSVYLGLSLRRGGYFIPTLRWFKTS